MKWIPKSREYRLEALKQRIIGCNLELFNERNKKYVKYEDYQHIISRHFGRLENINEFLEGKKSYPSKHVQKMIQTREKSDDRLLKILQKLEEVGDLLELPQQVIKTSGFVCILDTNAISNFKVSRHLMNKNIQYQIPAEVLIELANWHQLQRVPWELDGVEIKEVINAIPLEIENMFSKIKGKPPSLADKKVATLAYELRANAIVSNDRDLWDSGLSYNIEKNFGYRIEIIRPHYFENWLEKHDFF